MGTMYGASKNEQTAMIGFLPILTDLSQMVQIRASPRHKIQYSADFRQE